MEESTERKSPFLIAVLVTRVMGTGRGYAIGMALVSGVREGVQSDRMSRVPAAFSFFCQREQVRHMSPAEVLG